VSGRLAVGVSGGGSNLRALVAADRRGGLGAEVVLVFADRACPAIDWAAEQGIDTAVLPGLAARDTAERAAADEALAETLTAAGVDVVVLAGYMRIVGAAVLAAFPNRILNVHPSLLPAFPGIAAIEQALAYGVKVMGVTVHFVDDGVDTGPVVLQESFSLFPYPRGIAEVEERVHEVEHRLLPRAVKLIAEGRVRTDPGNPRLLQIEDGERD